MDRRKALATAGAITGTLLAATLAAAANFGLLGLGEHDGSEVGKLRATRIAEIVDDSGAGAPTTTVAPEVEIRYEDVAVPAAATSDRRDDDRGGDDSHHSIDEHRDDDHSTEHTGVDDDD
ncbi:MAG TPA: hypothetical protein VFK42_08415 [Acidimicrobiales bacterium]|jgi:hypothetical protein|nr:hypothetical protein [Acidimicrobiales bacterium]